MKTTVIGISCLLIGFLAGLFVPVDRFSDEIIVEKKDVESPVAEPGFARADQGASTQSGDESESDQEMLEKNNTDPDSGRIGDTVVVPTALIAQLSKSGSSRNLEQSLIDPDGAIEQALQVTDREQARVQSSWQSTRQRIQELEVSASTVEEMEDLSVRITLPEMGSQMDSISDQFNQSVKEVLGKNRGGVFLAAKQIGQVLKKSAAERTYTIVAESPSEGEWRFNMTLESPAGRRVWVGDSIPDEIRHLTDVAGIFPSISELPDEE